MGYSVTSGIFSAAEVGASHRRERLFIMADSGHRSGWGERETEARNNNRSERSSNSDEVGNAISNVADAKSQQRRMGKPKGRLKETDITGRERELADNSGKRLEGGTRSVQEKRSEGFTSGGGDVADTMRAEPQGQQSGQHQQARREIKDGFATLQGRARLPYFAPGPNDPRWGEIIRQAPSLKPALCTMADGVANRTDELRAAGNGVCPMAGSIAWLSLAAHFE